MKFPLESLPFKSLKLSAKQCASLEQVAERLLHVTITDYDQFIRVDHRVLDTKQWKPIKSRENVTVFKQRETRITDGSSGTSDELKLPKSKRPNGSLPKMLAVGTVAGNLDDVLYGVISPDTKAIGIKTQYVLDEIVDGRVLYRIKSPTEQDPFQFLAVKWIVTSPSAVARPRDAVYVEATGYARLPNGKRIGYHILQSFDLPECPELALLGIQRSQFSSCFIFCPRDDNSTVEIYMKSHIEPGGLLGCWKSVWCAQNKKLAWMMRDADATRAREHEFQHVDTKIVVHSNTDGKRCCGICTKTLHRLQRTATCDVCRTAVCSRCYTGRKLAFVRHTGDIVTSTASFCKTCISRAGALSSADVARFEYVPNALEKRRTRAQSEEIRHAVRPCPRPRRGGSSSPLLSRHQRCQTDPHRSDCSTAVLESDRELEQLQVETVDVWRTAHAIGIEQYMSAVETPPAFQPSNSREEAMWRQMQELCVKIEQTYQLTTVVNTNIKNRRF